MKKLMFGLSLLLAAMLFTGCVTILSSDTTVTLDKADKWVVNQELLFEGESFAEYGQEVVDGLNLLSSQGLNTGLDIEFKQLPDRQGNVPYEVAISGEGLEKLNELFGSPGAFIKTEVDGETLVEFVLDGTNLSSSGLDIGFAPELSFTVEGLKVLETNGKKNSPTSVTWKNPNAIMEATFTTSTGKGMAFPWWAILLIVVGLAAIVLVILLITGVFKKKKPQSAYGPPYGNTQVYTPPIPQTSSMETVVATRDGMSQVPPIPPAASTPPPVPPQSNIPPPLPPVNN